jgi:hypothetical protein
MMIGPTGLIRREGARHDSRLPRPAWTTPFFGLQQPGPAPKVPRQIATGRQEGFR